MGTSNTETAAARVAQRGRAVVDLGRVVRPHAFAGLIRTELYGVAAANLRTAEVVTCTVERGTIPFRVRCAREAGSSQGHARVRMALSGLDSRERAEVWSGARLSIPEQALRSLPEGEFYWRELIGLRCRLLDGRDLGVIQEIWPGAQNDVLVVRAGSVTRLVPALRQLLVRLDRAAGELWIDPPAGLLEEE